MNENCNVENENLKKVKGKKHKSLKIFEKKAFYDRYNSETGIALRENGNIIEKQIIFGVYDVNAHFYACTYGEIIINLNDSGYADINIEADALKYFDFFKDDLTFLSEELNCFDNNGNEIKKLSLDNIKEILLKLGYVDITEY